MNKYIKIFIVLPALCFSKTNGLINASLGGLFSVGKFQSYQAAHPNSNIIKDNNPLNSKAFLGDFGVGIAAHQGWMYGETTLNLACAPLDKTIYSNNDKGLNQVKLTQMFGVGLNAKVGAQLPIGVMPYVSFGVEMMPQRLTYSAVNLQTDQVLRNNSPFYCWGFGFKTPINDSLSFNVETQYRHKKDFEMLKVSQSKGSPSLSGRRVKVSADQLAVKIGLSYKF